MTVTLNAIHLIDDGCYLVTRGHQSVEVDGIRVSDPTFVVSDLSSILSIRQTPRELTHYVNEEGETKPVEVFQDELKDLVKNAEENTEYSGDYIFSDLDEEFAYRRFIKTWKPVLSESQFAKEPVEVVVTEVRRDSGDPDIKSLWNAPKMEAKAHLYTLDRNKLSIKAFESKCLEMGLKFVIPSHSGVRYATIGGNYMFDDNMDFGRSLFVGTLEQCKQEKERILKIVNRVIDLYVAKKNNVNLANAAEVLEDLHTLLSQVSKISPMKVSRNEYIASTKLIRELIIKIENDLLLKGG